MKLFRSPPVAGGVGAGGAPGTPAARPLSRAVPRDPPEKPGALLHQRLPGEAKRSEANPPAPLRAAGRGPAGAARQAAPGRFVAPQRRSAGRAAKGRHKSPIYDSGVLKPFRCATLSSRHVPPSAPVGFVRGHNGPSGPIVAVQSRGTPGRERGQPRFSPVRSPPPYPPPLSCEGARCSRLSPAAREAGRGGRGDTRDSDNTDASGPGQRRAHARARPRGKRKRRFGSVLRCRWEGAVGCSTATVRGAKGGGGLPVVRLSGAQLGARSGRRTAS